MPPADLQPVASVYVDTGLAHLDRPFDYLVSEADSEAARPGVRVRVRFAGKLCDGYVVRRAETSGHAGTLAFLDRVVSPEVILTSEIADLTRAVADRWGGTFGDVVRLAIPPRHARVESAKPAVGSTYDAPELPLQPWSAYETGASYLQAIANGNPARAAWNARSGEDWAARYAELAATCAATGRGAVLLVPDRRDLDRLSEALERRVGTSGFVALRADLGPAERYRRFLAAARGQVGIVAGTRAAVYAPVHNLGLVAIWDDGDDLYDEPRAPYAHTRDVAVLRVHAANAALLLGGFAQSVATTALVERGWAHSLSATRDDTRATVPRIVAAGDDRLLARDEATHSARLPSVALEAARAAIHAGRPVLVQVPRRGYAPALACERCRTPARCTFCAGPLGQPRADGYAACRWCGKRAVHWSCPVCGAPRFRASVVGSIRTAEELGRAVPGARVLQSAGAHILTRVDPGPSLVVATPGAEPVVEGGYGAALLLDGWALLGRAELDAGEETLRRWMNAAAMVRPGGEGGRVIVMADSAIPVVQALIRWDPAWLSSRELAERTELSFPPAVRMASVTGTPSSTAEVTESSELPVSVEVLGPVPDPDDDQVERFLLRVPLADGAALARAVAHVKAARSAKKASDKLTVQLDPRQLV